MNMKVKFEQILEQAQKMQTHMQDAQKKLEEVETEGVAGVSPLQVKVKKKGSRFSEVSISEGLIKEDKDILEDMILAAVNDASNKFEAATQRMMGDLTATLDLPKEFLTQR